MIQLPGGVIRDGRRHRSFRFRPVTGAMELAIGEEIADAPSLARAVTHVLRAVLEEVAGAPPEPDALRALAIGDREYLVRRLARHLGEDRVWLTSECPACGERFDLEIEQSALPVREPGPGFPVATVRTAVGTFRLRVPCGGDQEALAARDDDTAVADLILLCLLESEPPDAQLGPRDLVPVEQALEAVSPEVGRFARATCPACHAVNDVEVDPYLCLDRGPDDLYRDVHRLAAVYHWSEAEILSLPVGRRRRYLTLIGNEPRRWAEA